VRSFDYSTRSICETRRNWSHFRAVTVGTIIRGWFVEEDRLTFNHSRDFVTLVTKNFGMPSREWEVSTGVMIEG
jgi:hypothetical protein